MSNPTDLAKNSIKLQSQIRQNAEEMSGYLADLNKWEENVKKKDKELKSKQLKPKTVKSVNSLIAPVNVSSSAPALPLGGQNGALTPASLVAHHSIVEVAPAAVPKATTEACSGGMEGKVREQGNAEYKKGNFVEAVKLYTKCIGLKSKNYIGFSNRAMAYIKMKDFLHAEVWMLSLNTISGMYHILSNIL